MAGFKSFAESVELDIDSGLTGIVGPNGCGKSNVVEGLRWLMGESSAVKCGGEMDDIIFLALKNDRSQLRRDHPPVDHALLHQPSSTMLMN